MIKVPAQFPSMPSEARIAFIGEAPSDEELAGGLPLIGPSGRVFNAGLRTANITREEHLVTNVFQEQAPDNDVRLWLRDEVRVAEARARLNEELEQVKPNVIVPMGNTALWALTGQTNITHFRGAVTAATEVRPGAKVIATVHPAAVIRAWHMFPLFTGDLMKAASEASDPAITYPKVSIFIEPTIEDLRLWLPEWQASPKLSVDIETGWGQITSLAFAPTTSRAMEVPFVDLRKPNKSYWKTEAEEFEAWRIVEAACRAPNPKVGQNFMYDIMWLYAKHHIPVTNYRFDTRLRHKVLYPELAADLATMSASYTRVGAYKGWGGRYQKDVEKKDG